MSKNHDAHRAGDLVPVKFSRLTRRGVLLGLSLAQLVVLGLGVGTLVWAFYAGGGILITLTSPVWLASAVVVWVRVAGRAIVEWIPVFVWWVWKTTAGQLLYRRRVVKPRPAGTLALPGAMARLRDYDDPVTGAGGVCSRRSAGQVASQCSKCLSARCLTQGVGLPSGGLRTALPTRPGPQPHMPS